MRRNSHVLESQSHRQLNLSRISDTLTEIAVKVEEARSRQRVLIARTRQRVDEVVVVECIEHLDLWRQLDRLGQLEILRQAPVEREVLVILSQRVSIRRGTH